MKRILIVEDNELNMKLVFDILQYQKYEPIKAEDGEIAYEKIKSENFDLIILDIQLPKLNGFELLEKLRKENISLPPIIISSACAMDSDKELAKKYGINEYITKPIDLNNFVKTVKHMLND